MQDTPRPAPFRRGLIAAAWTAALIAPLPAAGQQTAPAVVVTATRLDEPLPAASTTIIDAEEIANSPAATLPELLGTVAGVQSRDLFGGVAGARGTVDMRGFGAPGSQNMLVLLNGRRLNDIDLAAIDYAAVPRESIERIEITRGSAGAVLYGDGAVGGVVNIVTKPAVNLSPLYRAEGAVGSDVYREGSLSAAQTAGDFSVNAYANYIRSDGYRDNNDLRQRNAVAELRHSRAAGDVFLRLNVDDQSLGLPGARRVTLTSNLLETDRRGATTPRDQAKQNGIGVATGFTHRFASETELIVDAGYRIKDQTASIIDNTGGGFNQFVDTELATWSLTPRAIFEATPFGKALRATAGIDLYYSDYNSDRKRNPGEAPIHRYDASQTSAALYLQNRLGLTDSTRLMVGGRAQLVRFKAGDRFDAGAPGAFGVGSESVDETDTLYAFNLGLEQRITEAFEVFGRVGRSFRVPTVDERIGTEDNTSFALEIQTSRDAEIGSRLWFGQASLESTLFVMETKNEIRFNPELNSGFGANSNFDPIRRVGFENRAVVPLGSDVTLTSSLTLLEAKFTDGAFDGKDVPLVSDVTASVGLGWRVGHGIRLDALLTLEAERWLENDEENTFPKTPMAKVLDLKISGEHGRFNWSAAVNNVFDYEYFNYGVASTTTFGTYNAYPLPGRTFMLRGGVRL